MNIDSDKIEALYELSLNKTFSKAADILGISQPALSKKIARLEDELESSLVIRNSKGITLTQAGIEIVKYHQQKRELDIELLNKLSLGSGSQLIGEINIATHSSVGRSVVLPCLSTLMSDFKELKINFLIKEARDLEDSLLSGEVNFVVSNFQINRENVLNDKLGEEENVHIVPSSKKYSEFYLDHDKYDQTTISFLKHQGKSVDIKRNYFDEIYGIIDAVSLGLGQAIVSKHLIEGVSTVKVKKYKKKMISPLYLSYYDRTYFPLIHTKVIDVLNQQVKGYLGNSRR